MSDNRKLYFDKNIRNQKTSLAYIEALKKSPYRTHRRMAVNLAKADTKIKGLDVDIFLSDEMEIRIENPKEDTPIRNGDNGGDRQLDGTET